MSHLNTRAHAAQILVQVLPLGRQNMQLKSLSELMPAVDDAAKDKGLLQELSFGVCRWYTRLDKLAAPLVKQPFKTKDADIHALLLVGLYQLFYLRIPDHAAISETVEGCRQLNKTWAVKVVNGMLRNAQRQKTDLLEGLPQSSTIQHAHPKWLVDAISAAWPEQTDKLIKANNIPGPLCLRVNSCHHTREQYLQLLKQANINARPGEHSPVAVYLEKAVEVEQLPGFEDGWVSVQDEAAQLSALLLDPQPGDRILDACAAPGGKTCHLLEQQPQIKELVALDADAKRLQKVEQNLERLQLNAHVVHASLQQYASDSPEQSFDRILLDAPCSATGVIRRHPDIKWLRKRGDIKSLAQTQAELLQQAFLLLKPGGILVYATCSVLPQENSRVISAFLQENPQAQLLPTPINAGIDAKPGRQLFPLTNGHDGFYYACIKRC